MLKPATVPNPLRTSAFRHASALALPAAVAVHGLCLLLPLPPLTAAPEKEEAELEGNIGRMLDMLDRKPGLVSEQPFGLLLPLPSLWLVPSSPRRVTPSPLLRSPCLRRLSGEKALDRPTRRGGEEGALLPLIAPLLSAVFWRDCAARNPVRRSSPAGADLQTGTGGYFRNNTRGGGVK